MQILVDTSVWVDYFNGVTTLRTEYLDAALGRAPLVLADLILLEVLGGFADPAHIEQAHRALQKFWQYELGGSDLCFATAANRRLLLSRGEPVQDGIDCLIATFCIRRNIALLHSDPNFLPFERHLGLKVPDPGMPAVE